MRLISLLILSLVILSACNPDDGQLPTQIEFPGATKTLIPTQSQQLTTPTLPEDVVDANSRSVDDSITEETSNTSSEPTNTPIICNVQDDWDIYVIQRGDNLVGIAQRTGSTVDELTAANCLENPNRLRTGQELYVPNLPASPTTVATSAATKAAPVATIRTATPNSQTIITPTSTSVTANHTSTPTQSSVAVSIHKTFESEIGFGLKYPVDWFIIESTTSTVENIFITSFEYTLGDEIPQNRWTDDMVSITIAIFKETTDESLTDWSQSTMNQFQNANNIAEVFIPVELRTDGELEGRSIDYVTDDDTIVRNYYFIINDHKVQINVGGNFDLAVPVINSLQPSFQ